MQIPKSIFLAAVVSFGAVAQAAPTCGPPATGWAQTLVINHGEQVNTVVIFDRGDHSPTWNGTPISADNVREYLAMTAQMSPQPVFLLIVSPLADCHEVDTYRRMATDVLKCGSGRCVEVTP